MERSNVILAEWKPLPPSVLCLPSSFRRGAAWPLGGGFTSERESNHVGLMRLLARIWEAITSITRPPNAATLFRRADLYRQEGRFEEAAELVAQGLRLSPNNGVGHLLSAYLHLAFRQIGPAKSEFQSVLQADPYHPRALLGLAKIALEERDFGACRPFLDKALQYYPDFPEARALQEMVAGWVTAAGSAGQAAYAGPTLQVEKLKPPAAGREFVLTQADGTLVFSHGDKDGADLAAHVTQVYRIASATLQR